MENEDTPSPPASDAQTGQTPQTLSYFHYEESRLSARLVIALILGFALGLVAAVVASFVLLMVAFPHQDSAKDNFIKVMPVLCEVALCLVGTIKIIRWIARYRRERLSPAEDRNKASRFFGIGVRLAFIVLFPLVNLLMLSWIIRMLMA